MNGHFVTNSAAAYSIVLMAYSQDSHRAGEQFVLLKVYSRTFHFDLFFIITYLFGDIGKKKGKSDYGHSRNLRRVIGEI